MEKKNFGNVACPMARSLEHVGQWWTMLILRDCFYGETRFDAIQKSLGIAPNILTRRLNDLVESGILTRHQYCDRPPRSEYLLTRRGRDFRPVLLALMEWGNRHFSPNAAPPPTSTPMPTPMPASAPIKTTPALPDSPPAHHHRRNPPCPPPPPPTLPT